MALGDLEGQEAWLSPGKQSSLVLMPGLLGHRNPALTLSRLFLSCGMVGEGPGQLLDSLPLSPTPSFPGHKGRKQTLSPPWPDPMASQGAGDVSWCTSGSPAWLYALTARSHLAREVSFSPFHRRMTEAHT